MALRAVSMRIPSLRLPVLSTLGVGVHISVKVVRSDTGPQNLVPSSQATEFQLVPAPLLCVMCSRLEPVGPHGGHFTRRVPLP